MRDLETLQEMKKIWKKRGRKRNQLQWILGRNRHNLERRRIQATGSDAIPVMDEGICN